MLQFCLLYPMNSFLSLAFVQCSSPADGQFQVVVYLRRILSFIFGTSFYIFLFFMFRNSATPLFAAHSCGHLPPPPLRPHPLPPFPVTAERWRRPRLRPTVGVLTPVQIIVKKETCIFWVPGVDNFLGFLSIVPRYL